MKKNILFFVLFTISLISLSFLEHDFQTSMTKVEYNSGSKTLKFATKVDIGQIESVLGRKVSAGDFDGALKSYLQKNVDIYVNDSQANYIYTGKQESGEVIWVYYEVNSVNEVSTIEVRNSLFFEKSPNQQNFISFNINDKKGSFICTKSKDRGKYSF